MGSVRNQIETLSNRLQEKFHPGNKPAVPHITLAGPFSTSDGKRLVDDFTRVCTAQETVPKYTVGGYGFFDDTRVVCVMVTPDENLKQFRYDLAKALLPYCTMREYDRTSVDDFLFHATLAMKLDWLTYRRIRWQFRNQEKVVHRPHPIRATLLQNSKILCEYDFTRKRMLTPAQARSRATMVRDRRVTRVWDHEGRN
jgi:2'-5' RNA ligase